ncbi:hypothetical protein [Natranaerobius trueperi]|uniref:Uncharacterized protein n=1 Tax=Natranaerobius trueperi TaxID=759412 RepID=A0A226C0N9_9FIRM|nr:hypothetical protein [Natranaerobius trueperi]OWZ84868.1 hypothetical protein CDO51_00220 [Natranaerobius trueperi]
MEQQRPKLEHVKTKLEKIEARTLGKSNQEGTKHRLSTDWNYQIKKRTKEFIVLAATCRTWFIPEGLFEIFTEFTLVYRSQEEITRDQLENSMERLLLPAGEQNAMMVAQITDKMRGSPMVISPQVKLKNKDVNLN